MPMSNSGRFNRDEMTGLPHLEARYAHWRPQGVWHRENQFSDGTLRLIALLWSLLEGDSLSNDRTHRRHGGRTQRSEERSARNAYAAGTGPSCGTWLGHCGNRSGCSMACDRTIAELFAKDRRAIL